MRLERLSPTCLKYSTIANPQRDKLRYINPVETRPEVKKAALQKEKTEITPQQIQNIKTRLSQNKRVRRTLPLRGRLHIDRQLPFLSVYRRPHDRPDPSTNRLIRGEASYLLTSSRKKIQKSISSLVSEIVETLAAEFGAFLIVELWSGKAHLGAEQSGESAGKPGFKIFIRGKNYPKATLHKLEIELKKIRIQKQVPTVEIFRNSRINPPGLIPLIRPQAAKKNKCYLIGLEVTPIYQNPETGEEYPLIFRALQRALSLALRRTYFEFTLEKTPHRPGHYHALGRRAMVKAVREIDRRLAELNDAFEFLLLVTPVNSEKAWSRFKQRKYEEAPQFQYRPVGFDPDDLKRRLFEIPIEHIEDPTLAHLFNRVRLDMEKRICMIQDRGTRSFLYGSLGVYGGIEDKLLDQANEVLRAIPARSRERSGYGYVSAEGFAAEAEKELLLYKQKYPELDSKISIRSDVTGLLVSRGNLYISDKFKVSGSRVKALLQHEVGTHILTYYNGQAQPFRQLNTGLPNYFELQEGLAVLSEYLVGGFGKPRLRLLAARVYATKLCIEGATFVEIFRKLHYDLKFEAKNAFVTTLRVCRGGGLTKDAVYFRGLVKVLNYLKRDGDLELLLVGKISFEHIPMVRELLWRKVLRRPPLRPSYLDDPESISRLEKVRQGIGIMGLVRR